MVNVYYIVKYLCDREGISISSLCNKIGISRSTMTELKHERSKSLSHANMVKIANYFNVSTDVFNEGVFEETLTADEYEEYFKNKPALPKKDEHFSQVQEYVGILKKQSENLQKQKIALDNATKFCNSMWTNMAAQLHYEIRDEADVDSLMAQIHDTLSKLSENEREDFANKVNSIFEQQNDKFTNAKNKINDLELQKQKLEEEEKRIKESLDPSSRLKIELAYKSINNK